MKTILSALVVAALALSATACHSSAKKQECCSGHKK